jgi:hypothetical protein
VRCAAITSAGERCRLDATSGSYCWSHDPENAEERRRRARRGGKAKGAGELSEIKREIRAVIAGVLTGRVDKGKGAVVLQGYNTLLRAVEVERKIKETDEQEERIAALERKFGVGKGAQWGA